MSPQRGRAELYTEPVRNSTRRQGYLYPLLPALQAGFSEDWGSDEFYTAQGTGLPGVTE